MAATALGGAMAQGLGTTAAISPAEPAEDPIATIEKLHKLVTLGALSQEEFEVKNAELLLRRSGSPNRRRRVACGSASARFWIGHSPRGTAYRSSRGGVCRPAENLLCRRCDTPKATGSYLPI
ncbi:hypothetical protein [Novosphingobium panipatense]|uniref:hypothetical protein n=1 Tax=Novosphingobium panipatense TaxID=428991 RepID=UPI0024B7B760|nr:hypothetical protein [Novosphingobium panipatense]